MDPWWVSVVSPVNGDRTTTLTYLLGFEHEVGLEFLVGTELLKHETQNTPSFSVMQAEWDKFRFEENLDNMMEAVNRTSLSRNKYYFINYSKKEMVNHRPIDQSDTKKTAKSEELFIIE